MWSHRTRKGLHGRPRPRLPRLRPVDIGPARGGRPRLRQDVRPSPDHGHRVPLPDVRPPRTVRLKPLRGGHLVRLAPGESVTTAGAWISGNRMVWVWA